MIKVVEYDAMNRPTVSLQPDGSVVKVDYNKAGLPETTQTKLRGETNWTDFITDTSYNEKGQKTEIYYANGSKTKMEYDTKTFRLKRILTTRNTGIDILQNIYYFYDAVGNIIETCDYAQQTFNFSNTMITPQSKYWYDSICRLLRATGRELASLNALDYSDFVNTIPVPSASAMQNYTHYYSYDALGNIQSVQSVGGNGWTRTYNYNTANNYLTSTQIGQDASVYSYDIQGNMLTMPHLSAMDWDYSGNLKKSTCGVVNTWYCYDIQGVRVRKVTEKQGGIKEERIYLNGYEVYRKHVSGVIYLERQSLNILDVKQVEEGEGEEKQVKFEYDYNKKNSLVETKTVENGEEITTPTPLIRYQYDNHLGSACLELDASAAIVSYEEYHPFGTTSYRSGRTETEVSLKRYKYVGKERDEETGLYYYGARYYAAWICRFVSVDALQFKYPELTPYQYASNGPVAFIDLDGLEKANKNEQKNRFEFSLPVAPTDQINSQTPQISIPKNLNIQKYPRNAEMGTVRSQNALIKPQNVTTTYYEKNNYNQRQSDYNKQEYLKRLQATNNFFYGNPGQPVGSSGALGSVKAGAEAYGLLEGGYGIVKLTKYTGKFALTRMGYTSIVAKGESFAEKAFLSEKFGITSNRFANSITGVKGTWNNQGGFN